MKRALLAGALLMVGGLASADPILNARPCAAAPCTAPGWLWEYTFRDPTGDPDWATTPAWTNSHMGNAPFGNNTGGFATDPVGYFDRYTSWPVLNVTVGDDLWVRTTIDLTGFSLASIAYNLGVDNGYKLYINGVFVAGANAELYTSRWEYGGSLASFVSPGVNYVAVALEDHGGLTAFDMEITGTAVPESGTPVPEAGTLLLIGSGISALALRRKKTR